MLFQTSLVCNSSLFANICEKHSFKSLGVVWRSMPKKKRSGGGNSDFGDFMKESPLQMDGIGGVGEELGGDMGFSDMGANDDDDEEEEEQQGVQPFNPY